MEFTTEWKSRWPISSTFSAPLLIPDKSTETPFGPIIFTPKPNSTTTLLQSSSLAPCLPPPYPNLSLSKFLQNHNSVPSSATSISSVLGPQLPNYSSYFHGFNSLQLLQIPNKNLIIVFFPTGENSDDVGFSLLSVKDGILSVHSQKENSFKVVKQGNASHQRITRLLVNPVDDFCGDDMLEDVCNVNRRKNVVSVVGFVMVCTHYSVCWYRVGISAAYAISLDYLGCANARMLRGNTVVSACWSPHLREECLVLLENGDLLLFDVTSSSSGKKVKSSPFVTGNIRSVNKKMKVSLTDKVEEKGEHWLACEFSWHPRIFIISHQNGVFLVDLRYAGECNISCLLKLEMVSMGKSDGLCALSRAGSDGFTFTVVTRYLLLLCDVRKPLMPVLQWAHGIQNPHYMTVCKLSDLRGNAEDTKYRLASESGYCIILGSFWDDEFGLFCYGPDGERNGSICTEILKFCNSYYAWGLPSKLSFLDSDCNCGNCLVHEEFFKASRSIWIDWRQKKSLTLGFGILEPSFSAQLSSLNAFGSFTLIRLTSSGKLEAQPYIARWESEKFSEADHKRKYINLEDNLLYDCKYSEYDMEKKFQHLKFEFLDAYMKGKLAKYIVKRRARRKWGDGDEDTHKKYSAKSESNFHHEICHRMKAFGIPKFRSSLEVSTVLKDINLPTSIHEIALRSMCVSLPTNLLQLAFSDYSDLDENPENEPLEFLDIPDQLQVPPFPFRKPSIRSSKWSSKIQPSDSLVGPVLPPHFLTTLHKLSIEEHKQERDPYPEDSEAFSAHSQFKLQCEKVIKVVQEHVSVSDAHNQDDDFVSLADDTEDMSYSNKKLKFSYHKPSAFLGNPSIGGLLEPGFDDKIFSTHVFRRNQEGNPYLSADMARKELFDVGCPIELKFDDSSTDFGPKELEAFQKLKKQDLEFQKSCKIYQDYINR